MSRRTSMLLARAQADAAAKGLSIPVGAAVTKKRHVEDDEQEFIFQTWQPLAALKWPVLELLHAIPNGGNRNKFEAERLRRQGVRAGVLDLDLPVPRFDGVERQVTDKISFNGFVGLRIELKRPKVPGKPSQYPSPEQKWWASALQDQGHCVCICYGATQAIDVLEAYLTGRPVPHQWSRK